VARNDINLSVGVDLRGIDAVGRQIHDSMSQAGGGAGRNAGDLFSKEFAKKIQLNEAPIRRAYERVVVSISRQTEVMEKLKAQQEMTAESARTLARENRSLAEVQQDTSASADRLAEAQDRARQASVDHSSQMSKQISLQSQLTRANNQHVSSLMSVSAAQSKVIEDANNDLSILSAGKYISALRAVALPASFAQAFAIGTQLAGAAAAAAQAILLIPAAATAAGAAIGTMQLATAGFGDAIKDIGDPDKFATALRNLSPNAQQAALSIQALMEPLTELKNATQDALFLNFGPMINQLTNEYLPMIESLTTGIAGAFNGFATQLSATLQDAGVKASLGEIVNNIVVAFQNLTPAVDPLIRAFTKLTEVGSGFLPEIATAAARAATSFANFIDAAARSGELEGWLRGGLEAVYQIGRGLWALGEAFMALAPTGEKVLPDIVRALEQIDRIMPAIARAALLIGPNFGTIELAAKASESAIKNVETVAILAGRAVEAAMRVVGGAIDLAFAPIRNIITLINSSPLARFLGGGLPQIPSAAGLGGLAGGLSAYLDSTPLAQRGPGQFRRQGGSSGRGSGTVGETNPPRNPFGAFGLPAFPTGGYPLPPLPAPAGSGGSSASEPPPFFDPSLYSVDSLPVAGGISMQPQLKALDDALLSNVPSGRYDSVTKDLTLGLADCASSVEDLVNMLQGQSTVGGSLTTFNAEEWLLSRGFMPGLAEGAFNVGFTNQGTPHMEATLPGGTNFNFGNNTDAAAGGRTSSMGAYSPNLEQKFHLPVVTGMMPNGAMPGAGYFEQDPQAIFDATSAVERSKNDVEQKRLRLLELEAKGTATQRELLTAKNDVAEAERTYQSNQVKLAEAQQGKFKQLDQAVTGAASRVASSMGEIGAELAGDFGLSEGLPGIAKFLTTALANMAFAPMMGSLAAISASAPIQGGHGMFGMMGAQNMAAGGSPLGLSMPPMMPGAAIPPMMPGPAMPGTGIPPMMPAPMTAPGIPMPSMIGPAPLGGGMHGGAGGAPPGPTSMSPGGSVGGGGFQGIGGLPMEAMMGATAGLNMIAPGAGQAAQVGMKLANRAAGFAGQVAGIGVGGLLETFLPNNSSTADPSKSWIGKIASGVAGARPALPNSAGSAPAQPPMPQQGGAGSGGPMVNIESMVNQTPDGGQSVANQIGRMQMSGYGAGGPR
jgi:hypothetical protein